MRATRERLSDDLTRAGSGDVAAFVRVYQATSRKLYGVVVRILGRGDLADEVLQEVYMRVWTRAGDFRPEQASPVTWLVAIARNRALDELRRKRPGSLDEVPDLLEWPSGEDIAAEHLLGEEMERLRRCLDGLEPERRRLVELVYFEGLTREDVALHVGQTPATVRSALRASLAQIKGCLEDE
jgi:RNA polymerase sigma-70 factor (ECF subfamily)